jgi:dual specificity tyrosine-phosphorylation-regulated kinase 2/3/4
LAGENEADQLSCIAEVLGLPPPELLAAAKRTAVFFKTADGGRSVVLKPSSNSHGIVRSPGGSSLEHALRGAADKRFLDFLCKCLKLDPRQRISPGDAERHEWMVADD